MTIFGKILVFLNLVFALIVGGLLMVDFLTRANWQDAYNKQKNQALAVDADRAQVLDEYKSAKTDYDANLQKKDNDIAALRAQLDVANRKAATLEQTLNTIKNKQNADNADVTAIGAGNAARKKQVEELEKTVDTLRAEKLAIIEEKNAERRARIQADVDAKTFKSRNLELENVVREMQRALTRATSGAGTVVSRKKGEENPPADNVEGQIVTVDSEDNLVKLSIGSDAGLIPGHTLKVFRLDPIPERSQYLGVIEILQVRPLESVARPLRPMTRTMRPGDRVASTLFGGR
jgi:hypothetical protein